MVVVRTEQPRADFQPVFDEVDARLASATPAIRDLIIVGFMEALQNVDRENATRWESLLGPESRRAWEALNDVWAGRILLRSSTASSGDIGERGRTATEAHEAHEIGSNLMSGEHGPMNADECPRTISDLVANHGWAAVGVDGSPPFVYTTGLGALAGHAELIVVGLPNETGKWLLDQAVSAIRDGRTFSPGDTVHGLMGSYDIGVVQVSPDKLESLAFAADQYGGFTFDAVQLVWPDRDGRFPWDLDVDPRLAASQPLLGKRR
jgi:hypothetical protein